jgi:preprotein translocase subunit SecY
MALPGLAGILIAQIAMGSVLLLYMDELVSKWGIGSGIGLFIAGGVSQTIIVGSFNFLKTRTGEFPGAIISFLANLSNGEFMLILLFPVVATIIVFLIVVYGESMKLEIPLSYGGMRGVGGRYPLKFFYVSNLPVILAVALLANVQLWPSLVGVDMNTGMDMADPNNPQPLTLVQNIFYQFVSYVTLNGGSHVPGLYGILRPDMIVSQMTDPAVLLHLFVYLIVFLFLCVLFGKFWVQTTGLGAEKVAEQIQSGGMQIPGFRRDPRVVRKVLDQYIPQITIISSIAVGLVAVLADLMGAIGTGTGILLTVGILYRMYEAIQKEQMAEMHPMMRKFMGKS